MEIRDTGTGLPLVGGKREKGAVLDPSHPRGAMGFDPDIPAEITGAASLDDSRLMIRMPGVSPHKVPPGGQLPKSGNRD